MKEKSLLGSFSRFVLPNIFGMIGLSCYILADTFFVSKGLGINGLAALNLAIAIYSFIHATGLMIGIGGATRFAILRSQGDAESANSVFSHSVALGLTIGAVLLMVGIFASEPLARLLGANGETFAMTNTYLKTILCFSPAFILNNILIAFIRNDNAPRLAMGGMLLGSFSNVILDYIMIFPLNMGMFGAAFATGLAPIFSILLLSRHFIKGKNTFHLHRCRLFLREFADLLGLGISAFITEISSGVVLIVFNIVILRIAGNVGVAAYGVVANVSLVAISIFVGIAQGIQPLVSKNYGENNTHALKQVRAYALILAGILAVIIYSTVNIFASQIIAVFNSESNVQLAEYAKTGIAVYFLGFFFAGVNIVMVAFLSASQMAKRAFLISCVRGIIAILPLVIILPQFFSLTGVWLVFPCAEAITTALWLLLSIRNMGKNKSKL